MMGEGGRLAHARWPCVPHLMEICLCIWYILILSFYVLCLYPILMFELNETFFLFFLIRCNLYLSYYARPANNSLCSNSLKLVFDNYFKSSLTSCNFQRKLNSMGSFWSHRGAGVNIKAAPSNITVNTCRDPFLTPGDDSANYKFLTGLKGATMSRYRHPI